MLFLRKLHFNFNKSTIMFLLINLNLKHFKRVKPDNKAEKFVV